MSNKKAVYRFDNQPIVRVKLENPHDSSALPVHMPALIDTGAYASAMPAYLCQLLGHSFENGITDRLLLVLAQERCGRSLIPQG